MITALLTLVVQGALYFVTVRDDVRDLKAEMRAVKCEVSVGFKRPILPDGCNLNSALLLDANGVQQAGAPAVGQGVTP